jgi:hyperosmotically inducible periplasmic protein
MHRTATSMTIALAITGALLSGCTDSSTTAPTADRRQPADTRPATPAPTAGQVVDDSAITAAVKTKLTAEQLSNVANIDVDTTRGTVTLSGKVDTSATKERVIQVARSVSGVRDVVDNLSVQ